MILKNTINKPRRDWKRRETSRSVAKRRENFTWHVAKRSRNVVKRHGVFHGTSSRRRRDTPPRLQRDAAAHREHGG